jgi:hypothetical protein
MDDHYKTITMRFSRSAQDRPLYLCGAVCADFGPFFEPFGLQFVKQHGRNPVAVVPAMIPNRPAALRRAKIAKDFGSPHV